MKELTIYEFQAKDIEDCLRLCARTLGSKDRISCLDRDVMQCWKTIQNVIEGKKDERVSRFIAQEMTQEEIEKLAEKLYPISPNPMQKIEGFERVAFIRGYRSAQQTMFTEDEIRKAYQNYDDCEGWFECANSLIKELKQNK